MDGSKTKPKQLENDHDLQPDRFYHLSTSSQTLHYERKILRWHNTYIRPQTSQNKLRLQATNDQSKQNKNTAKS